MSLGPGEARAAVPRDQHVWLEDADLVSSVTLSEHVSGKGQWQPGCPGGPGTSLPAAAFSGFLRDG